MSVANINAKTFANLNSEAANAVGKAFSKYLHIGSNTSDVFSKFEGADGAMGSPVCRKTELGTMAGKKIEFTIKGQLSGFGKLGEQTLRGNEEKRRYGTTEVEVDFIRHAEAYTRKQIAFMAANGEVRSGIAKDLADWWARKKQTAALHRLRQRAQSGVNIIYPNARGGIHSLRSADTFSVQTINKAQSLAQQLGAKPLKMGKSKAGAPIPNFMFFGPEQVINPITADSTYTAALNNAQVRGYGNNEFWDGGIAQVMGQTVFHWATVDPDSDGPIGSMFDPRAKLGTAITAGTTAIDITGGSSTSALYFEFFPGYAWLHYEEESVSADSNDYYVLIYNHVESTNGAGDAGKWGFYRYTGSSNTGNKLTMKNENGNATTGAGARLAGSTSGKASTKIGEVVWDANVNTTEHPTGAWIYLANKKGQIYGYVAALGSNALLRAYGGGAMGEDMPVAGKFQTEDEDYGMIKGVAIEAVYGTEVWTDTQGHPTNYVLIPCAYTPNGLSLPTIT